ncbi:hypothetical protein [Brevibacillus laterosporus]|uniref:GAP1-N2 domain-containing protein n=1 Tax=Brevibacillus laterosporus TaxID=1465 RepID=UPI0018CEFF98|nr:hypothetical protein [Brevibacillus laterosporus]
MGRQHIQQQYYTRGRQGIFRSNEGYDTVSKSASLDNSFIKKTLHPFCVYNAPKELQEKGETQVDKYPEALFCFRAESGEMVIGKSVYVGADFTGQRNTFFTHNYVIPSVQRDEFCKTPAKIFGISSFTNHHEETNGKELPELEDLPYHNRSTGDKKQILARLGIDEQAFKQLLFATMSSLSTKKKVFISLDVDISETSEAATQLVEILYGCLPYEMRRQLGFLTYTNEPESKKYLHVIFVEKGSIRSGNGHMNKDFLFDFANKSILHADIQGEHEYLTFAWNNLNEAVVLKSFYEFADEILAGEDLAKGLSTTTYYELCTLFLIETGQMNVYERNKTAVWQVLLQYIRNERLMNKKRLFALFRLLFEAEKMAVASKSLPSVELITLISEAYNVVENQDSRKEIIMYMMDILLKGKSSQQTEYVTQIYKQLSGNHELFRFMMSTILSYEKVVKPLFEEYVAQRLVGCNKLDDVVKEMNFWANHASQAFQNHFFMNSTEQKLLSLLKEEKQKVEATLSIHQMLGKWRVGHSHTNRILEEIDKCLLKHLSLEALSKEDVRKVVSLFEHKPQSFFTALDSQSEYKLELLMNVFSLEKEPGTPMPEEFYRNWDKDDIQIQQKLIRKMLGSPLDEGSFPKVALVFYRGDSQNSHAVFDFDGMLTFVEQHGGDETTYLFIQWLLKQRLFLVDRKLVPSYRLVLKQYLLHDHAKRLRDKEWRKRWYAIRNPEFREMLHEAEKESSNAVARFFRQNKGMAVIGLLVMLTVGTVGGVMLYSKSQAPIPATLPATETTPVTGAVEDVTPIFVEKGQADSIENTPIYMLLQPNVKPVIASSVPTE